MEPYQITIIHLNRDPINCWMCGKLDQCNYSVPWYCGPVLEGQSEGGRARVCKSCIIKYDKAVEKWDARTGANDGKN